MSTRRLIIHIGTEKTGTTTLQHFLHHNAKTLEKLGIWYPTDPTRSYNERKAQFPLAGSLANSAADFVSASKEKTLSRCLADFCSDAESAGQAVTVISAEHFSSRVENADQLKRFREQLSTCFTEIQVVCYVRNQADLALSSYSTDIVHGARHIFDPSSVSTENRYFNHVEMLGLWNSVFGREALVVREYDRSTLVQGDICRDFAREILGIDPGRLAFVAETNASLGAVFLELLRQINLCLPTLKDNASAWRHAQGLRSMLVSNLSIDNDVPLQITPKDRQALLDRFATANRQLNEIYLGGSLSAKWFDARAMSADKTGDKGTDTELVTRMTLSALSNLVIQLLSAQGRK